MANEAISEERLRKIQDEIEYARHVQESGNLSHIGEKLLFIASELLSSLREVQEQYRELSLSYITAVGQAQQSLERAEEAVRENDILRGMASRLMPCHYCGVDDMIKCPKGFPGCGLADDLLAGEDTLGKVWKERAEKAEEAVTAEREICAAMCMAENEGGDFVYDTRVELAEAIRARGEKQTEEDA